MHPACLIAAQSVVSWLVLAPIANAQESKGEIPMPDVTIEQAQAKNEPKAIKPQVKTAKSNTVAKSSPAKTSAICAPRGRPRHSILPACFHQSRNPDNT